MWAARQSVVSMGQGDGELGSSGEAGSIREVTPGITGILRGLWSQLCGPLLLEQGAPEKES